MTLADMTFQIDANSHNCSKVNPLPKRLMKTLLSIPISAVFPGPINFAFIKIADGQGGYFYMCRYWNGSVMVDHYKNDNFSRRMGRFKL